MDALLIGNCTVLHLSCNNVTRLSWIQKLYAFDLHPNVETCSSTLMELVTSILGSHDLNKKLVKKGEKVDSAEKRKKREGGENQTPPPSLFTLFLTLQDNCVSTLGCPQCQLVKGQNLTASLQNPSTGSFSKP